MERHNMLKIIIDIETIPDQSPTAVADIMETLTVKAPDLTKPKLIDALKLGADGKFKTAPELKEMWLEEFGESAKEDQAKAKWLKSSFDGGKGQICCICISTLTGGTIQIIGQNESDILSQLNDYVSKIGDLDGSIYFIGHNSIKFDLPFLHKRYVINQIKPSFNLIAHGRHGQNCFDTMVEWAGYGERISMNNLSKALGVVGKTKGMDGSQVWPEYQKGNIKKIAEYCADDVESTKAIYKRLTFQ